MRFPKVIFLVIIFVFQGFFSFAQEKFNSLKLDSLINGIEKYNQSMGALTLSQNGHIIYNRAWGHKAIEGKQPLKSDTQTKFRIGSITKMFTSVMVLQLVEEGKIKLDTKLSTYFPTIPNAKEITIENLLNHHSGIHNFTNDSLYQTYYTQPKSQQELIKIFSGQSPEFRPGEKAEYSNTNYVLLGFIIEKITGNSYAEELQKRIVNKIGLKNTYVGSKANSAKNEAVSFSFDGKKWNAEPETDLSIPGGAGAIVSTTNDLTSFIEALFAGKLLKKETLENMTELKDRYGFGIMKIPFYERHAFGHGGSIDEFKSMVGYFPKENFTYALTLNGAKMEMNNIAIGILSIYFDKKYEIPDFSRKDYEIDTKNLPRYTGNYASKKLPLKITITKDSDHLIAQATGQNAFPLTAFSETEFQFDPARITMIFKIENDGTVKEFTLKQGGGSFLFTKE